MRILSFIPFGIVLLTVAFPSLAEEDGTADPVTVLSNIDLYAFGGTGFAGTTSKGETLYNQIMKRETAVDDFLSIAEKGTPEAQMYALHALAQRAPQKYQERKKAADHDQEVTTMHGCIAGEYTMGVLLGAIDEQLSQKGTE